jgi:hypothetical protein|tara:strand:+ start:403 stop:576 length:174 start_codon:yes stop_codon:yes gene_type:complete
MKITKAKYVVDQLSNRNQSVTAVLDGVTWSVPISEDNTDYQAILEWVAAGNTIEEAD